MKANYPVEFMAASMTLDMQNTDKLAVFKQELDRMDIELVQPNVNKSFVEFKVDGKKTSGRFRKAVCESPGT